MEPHTASKLRMRKQNVLKDFVNVAGPLGVTHFMIFNQTDAGTNLVCGCPLLCLSPSDCCSMFRLSVSKMQYVAALDVLPNATLWLGV